MASSRQLVEESAGATERPVHNPRQRGRARQASAERHPGRESSEHAVLYGGLGLMHVMPSMASQYTAFTVGHDLISSELKQRCSVNVFLDLMCHKSTCTSLISCSRDAGSIMIRQHERLLSGQMHDGLLLDEIPHYCLSAQMIMMQLYSKQSDPDRAERQGKGHSSHRSSAEPTR